jgi:uncharacterized surface protein with fasciclin (FAS1) repeats
MKQLFLVLYLILIVGRVSAHDILDTARANGNFNTLLTALDVTGLDKALDGEGPFTVFAPTDEAFAKLPAGTLSVLLANPELLKGILLYHVGAGRFTSKQLFEAGGLETLVSKKVPFTKGGQATLVGGAKLIKGDIKTSNGNIHVIDAVLVPSQRSAQVIKQEILTLARSFKGQGDPDFSRQTQLEKLVMELLSVNSMAPVSERLKLLQTCWYQEWGPYDYRGNDRGVDNTIGSDEIYQCVFDGHYYNVSRQYRHGDRSRPYIGLLRGRYKLNKSDKNALDVRFTSIFSVKNKTQQAANIWELPPFAEAGKLENRLRSLPSIFVKLFFGGGSLRELYTDSDMRILFGSNNDQFKNPYLYIMTRVK